MALVNAGAYVGELRAKDGTFTRVTMRIDLTVTEGVTR